MTKGIENPGLVVKDSIFENRSMRLRAGNGVSSREVVSLSSVEIKFADLENEKQMAGVAALFNDPTVRPHLSGISPLPEEWPADIDVKAYARKHPRYNIVIATSDEIKNWYKSREHSHLIVALDKNTSEVVGTVTVDSPEGSGPGILYASISRLVVSKDMRRDDALKDKERHHLGRKLVKAAKAYILSSEKEGGLECSVIQLGVILGVEGKDLPLNLFESEGFENKGDFHQQCVSWDGNFKRFVLRSIRLMRLEVPASGKKLEHKVSVSEIPQKVN